AAGVARLALARVVVHADAGGGVDFDNPAAPLRRDRLPNVGHDQVHAADVEADHARRPLAHAGDVRVDLVGHVAGGAAGREVGRLAQEDALAGGRDVVERAALAAQVGGGHVV